MKSPVYNWDKKEVGSVELNDAIFAKKWNADLVHQVVLAQQANLRHPWAHAKGRGEVRGGGIKPWKQKGTGRARHGSIRSPIWRGGGVSHGPVKDRNYEQKINKKMLRVALHCVLSKKLADGQLLFVDSLALTAPKTKELAGNLKKFFQAKKQLPTTMLVSTLGNRLVMRASSNLPRVNASLANSLNVTKLLEAKNVLIEKEALADIK